MKLSQLLQNIAETPIDLVIQGLALDSRAVKPGYAFFAVSGEKFHGLAFCHQAIANGANAIIFDPAGMPEDVDFTVPIVFVSVAQLTEKLSLLAARFYDEPSQKMAVIGITGTNGKTTCSHLLAQGLQNCGLIGTLGWGDLQNLMPVSNTTPDAISVQMMLAHLWAEGKTAAAIEISSHGLQQGRVRNVLFTGAVFTNLSRDHLDYHQTMAQYFAAKAELFKQAGLKFAVINIDDAYGCQLAESLNSQVQCWVFSCQANTRPGAENILAENVVYSASGISFTVKWRDLQISAHTPLIGAFNLQNVLAVLAVMLAMGVSWQQAIAKLADLKACIGRMEKFGGKNNPQVIVDYAHTPDALEKALQAIQGKGQITLVFGCGGNRDKGKRAEMGQIAEIYADQVIITDDNPRYEAGADIISDILRGCNSHKVTVIHDRAQAIGTAIRQAAMEDTVLIAGKGHEDYQEVNGVRSYFSDQAIVKAELLSWDKRHEIAT